MHSPGRGRIVLITNQSNHTSADDTSFDSGHYLHSWSSSSKPDNSDHGFMVDDTGPMNPKVESIEEHEQAELAQTSVSSSETRNECPVTKLGYSLGDEISVTGTANAMCDLQEFPKFNVSLSDKQRNTAHPLHPIVQGAESVPKPVSSHRSGVMPSKRSIVSPQVDRSQEQYQHHGDLNCLQKQHEQLLFPLISSKDDSPSCSGEYRYLPQRSDSSGQVHGSQGLRSPGSVLPAIVTNYEANGAINTGNRQVTNETLKWPCSRKRLKQVTFQYGGYFTLVAGLLLTVCGTTGQFRGPNHPVERSLKFAGLLMLFVTAFWMGAHCGRLCLKTPKDVPFRNWPLDSTSHICDRSESVSVINLSTSTFLDGTIQMDDVMNTPALAACGELQLELERCGNKTGPLHDSSHD